MSLIKQSETKQKTKVRNYIKVLRLTNSTWFILGLWALLLGLETLYFRLPSDVIKEPFTGLATGSVGRRWRCLAKHKHSEEKESGGEEERPKVSQDGEEPRC